MDQYEEDDRVPSPAVEAGFLKTIIEDVGQYLSQCESYQNELNDAEKPVRGEMLQMGFILPSRDQDGHVLPLLAVDSSSKDITLGSLRTTIGIGVKIGETQGLQMEPSRVTGPNTEGFSHVSGGVRLQLELRFLSVAETLTIADMSYWSMLMESNKVITAYENIGDDAKLFSEMIKECFDHDGNRTLVKTLQNRNIIAMSKIASSAFICTIDRYRKHLPSPVADRVLMGKILRPGECTRSYSLKDTGHIGVPKTNIERRHFNERDVRLISEAFAESLYVTFYRPWEFHGAYRIEYHKDRFPDANALSDLYATVKHATRHPNYIEPVPQYLADLQCKSVHKMAELYGSINSPRFPDILKHTRSSDLE